MSNNVLATLKENAKKADETIALLTKHLAILEKEASKSILIGIYDLFLDPVDCLIMQYVFFSLGGSGNRIEAFYEVNGGYFASNQDTDLCS